MTTKEGTVFILTNEAMPGFVRFDYTTKDDLAARIERINRGEFPVPYRLNYAAVVPDCELLDRNVRFLFAEYCEPAGSHFFRMGPDPFKAAIELAATSVVEISDEELGITPGARAKMEKLKSYHDAVWFEALNVEAGTTLRFSKNSALSCTALGNGMVEFEGKVATPAQASIKAMQSSGFDWDEVSATEFWVPESEAPHASVLDQVHAPAFGVHCGPGETANGASGSPVMFVRNNAI